MCKYFSILFWMMSGIMMPALALAETTTAYDTGQTAGKVSFLMLLIWGVYKSFSISGRKTTNTKCAVALGLSLTGYAIISLGGVLKPYTEYTRIITIIAVIIGSIFFIVSFVLAIIGLLEYKQGYAQGRKQAVWAIVINALFIVIISIGAIKGFLVQIERQKSFNTPLASMDNLSDTELNYTFEAPDKPFVPIKPQTLNPHAKVAFINSKQQIFYIMIAEQGGADLDIDNHSLLELAQANLRSSTQSIEIGNAEPLDINGMLGLIFSSQAVIGGKHLSYLHWVCSRNGFFYQQILFSPKKDRTALSKLSRALFMRFRQINPDKVCYSVGSDPYGRYESAQFGYTMDLDNSSWIKWSDLKQQVPAADTGGLTANDVAAFFVSVLPFGKNSPGGEAIIGAFLHSIDIDRDDDKLTLKSHVNRNNIDHYTFEYSMIDEGSVFDYILKITIHKDRAYFLAVWTNKKVASVEKIFKQVDGAMEIAIIVRPIDLEQLDAHGKLVSADIVNRVGVYYENRKKIETASEYYTTAVSLDPTGDLYWDNALTALNKQKSYSAAVALIETYNDKVKLAQPTRSWYAWHLKNCNRKNEALATYQELFSSGYDNEEDFKYYVDLLAELDRRQLIDPAYDTFLKGRDRQELRIHQANIWYELNEHDKALAILERLDATSPDIAFEKIYNLRALRRYKEIVLICDQLIDRKIKVGSAYYHKGNAAYELKWYAKAKSSLEKAQIAFPDNSGIKARIKKLSGILGQGDNSAIKTVISAVPLPRQTKALMTDTADPDYIKDEGAYYLQHVSGYQHMANGVLKFTLRRKIRIVNAEGANSFSTYTINFNPVYERLHVNKLLVRDKAGKIVAEGNDDNYYIVDLNNSDEKSHEQTLNMPIPQLAPGCTIEIEATKILGNYDIFPFKRRVLSSRYPIVFGMLFVMGDLNNIEMEGENGVQFQTGPDCRIAYVQSPMKYRYEPNQVHYHSYLPVVSLNGMGQDWAAQGEQYLKKIKKQMVISKDIKKLSLKLTRNIQDESRKIETLYSYLQDNYKYMGIEFGSRGQIPYTASQTVRNKYGDCKDHAVLFHHLLESVGISNYLAFVNTKHTIRKSMPSRDQFNHIINYIPGDKGRFWDTTDKHTAANLNTPIQLSGCQALVLEPDNVRFVKIPDYKAEDSRIQVKRNFTIKERTMIVEEGLQLKGYYAAFMRGLLKKKNIDARHAWGQSTIQSYYPSGQLEDIKVLHLNDNNKPLSIDLLYTVNRKVNTINDGLIVNAGGVWEPYYLFAEPVKNRKTGFEVNIPFIFNSQYTVHIPDNLTLTHRLPKPIVSETRFGSYETRYDRIKDSIRFRVNVVANNGIFPKNQYQDYYRFNQKILEAASPTITLTNRPSARNRSSNADAGIAKNGS